MRYMHQDVRAGPPVPTEARGDPVAIDEREPLYADGEQKRPYYVSVMEMCGAEDFEGQALNMQWRSDATVRRSWRTPAREFDGHSLVCDLEAWR